MGEWGKARACLLPSAFCLLFYGRTHATLHPGTQPRMPHHGGPLPGPQDCHPGERTPARDGPGRQGDRHRGVPPQAHGHRLPPPPLAGRARPEADGPDQRAGGRDLPRLLRTGGRTSACTGRSPSSRGTARSSGTTRRRSPSGSGSRLTGPPSPSRRPSPCGRAGPSWASAKRSRTRAPRPWT
jgi:hypothetical protein